MAADHTRLQNHTVLVTGVGGPAGICATRYLKDKGYYVIGTDMRAVESDADLFFVVPAAGEASFVSTMLKITRDHGVCLLIPTVSEELPVFAKEKASFAPCNCWVMIAPYPAVEVANDKLETARFLEQHGVAVPITLPGATSHAKVVESIGMPIIAKPRVSRGGRGVFIYTHPEDLAKEQRSKIVYQEFMSGDEYDVNLYVNHAGLLQSCVVLHKTQLRDGAVGNALSAVRVQFDDVAKLAQRSVEVLGLTGPADIDIRLDSSGKPRLLEINARLGANAMSASEVMDDMLSDWKSLC